MDKKNITVAVGMSGGVDSSVAAALLKNEGYNVIGITMKIWDGSFEVQQNGKDACYGPGEEEDLRYAKEVCEKLDIPYYIYDLSPEYKKHVVEYFREEYLAGRTPNPCVMCNHTMKFGFLVDKAKEAGLKFDYFATGHYARIKRTGDTPELLKSTNLEKDQTYFLSRLKLEQLQNIMFPLGEYEKADVRKVAEELKLVSAARAESQDFISGGDYSPLFSDSESKPGDIVNEKGKVLGRHKGIIHYTVGQRKGLGISSEKPLYVLRVEAKTNRIVVSDKSNMFASELTVSDINMLRQYKTGEQVKCIVKIRQKHKESEAVLMLDEAEGAKILFDAPQLAVTPGQTAVFYDGDTVLGSGIIKDVIKH